jgi:hypothetical protein
MLPIVMYLKLFRDHVVFVAYAQLSRDSAGVGPSLVRFPLVTRRG